MDADNLPVLAGVLHLGRRARAAESTAALGFVIVNESRQVLEFRQSVICRCDGRIDAVSGLPEVDKDAPYVQWLSRLCRALEPDGPPIQLDAEALPESLPPEISRDWDDWLPRHLAVIALPGRQGAAPGLWMMARERAWREEELVLAGELADVYAHAWHAIERRHAWRGRGLGGSGRGRRRLAIAAACVIVAFIPVRLTVLAPAEVTAKDAFPVRAPLEGAVDVLHVRPNEAVAESQPLFDLDTTGLRTRLSVARQAFETAAEEYRRAAQLAVANDDQGRLELSQRKGRMEEKASELAYSEQLLDRVRVKAPRAGVAVFSDAADWIGKAVVIGERIMLIADPEQVEITIRLPVSDAIDLASDAPVTLYLTTAPQLSYAGQMTYIAYKAEVTEAGVAAYKVKADFDAAEQMPRLGLTGTAKLHGDRVPFIYYLMRRPLAVARQWVGW